MTEPTGERPRIVVSMVGTTFVLHDEHGRMLMSPNCRRVVERVLDRLLLRLLLLRLRLRRDVPPPDL
ncbi:hypothetical protein GCM10029964_054710 [Kibdelosporangium lantanae]